MNKFKFERVDSIRFERKFDDGSKASFTVGGIKTLKLEDADSLIYAGSPPINIMELQHKWDSVFDSDTQITIYGELHVLSETDKFVDMKMGGFDFRELCKGNVVCIKSY